mgnify:CR=1 FL=1
MARRLFGHGFELAGRFMDMRAFGRQLGEPVHFARLQGLLTLKQPRRQDLADGPGMGVGSGECRGRLRITPKGQHHTRLTAVKHGDTKESGLLTEHRQRDLFGERLVIGGARFGDTCVPTCRSWSGRGGLEIDCQQPARGEPQCLTAVSQLRQSFDARPSCAPAWGSVLPRYSSRSGSDNQVDRRHGSGSQGAGACRSSHPVRGAAARVHGCDCERGTSRQRSRGFRPARDQEVLKFASPGNRGRAPDGSCPDALCSFRSPRTDRGARSGR